jgi:hypothetical protein
MIEEGMGMMMMMMMMVMMMMLPHLYHRVLRMRKRCCQQYSRSPGGHSDR